MSTHDTELPPLFLPGASGGYTKEEMQLYAREAIEPYQAEIARLKRIIDSRPAINAGLPQTYIDWSHSIYLMEAARVLEDKQ